MRRVQWCEVRDGRRCFFVADQVEGGWVFFEKAEHEFYYHARTARRDLIAMAERLSIETSWPDETSAHHSSLIGARMAEVRDAHRWARLNQNTFQLIVAVSHAKHALSVLREFWQLLPF
jgi:hypothetical protein